jgi:hypothetical protein
LPNWLLLSYQVQIRCPTAQDITCANAKRETWTDGRGDWARLARFDHQLALTFQDYGQTLADADADRH